MDIRELKTETSKGFSRIIHKAVGYNPKVIAELVLLSTYWGGTPDDLTEVLAVHPALQQGWEKDNEVHHALSWCFPVFTTTQEDGEDE